MHGRPEAAAAVPEGPAVAAGQCGARRYGVLYGGPHGCLAKTSTGYGLDMIAPGWIRRCRIGMEQVGDGRRTKRTLGFAQPRRRNTWTSE